jgi:very-short-patch-repair endonuclease
VNERPIREELLGMGLKEGKDFFHEFRIPGYFGCKGQSVYYWLDFFIPDLLLDIEADGEIWHTFFDSKERDRRRDSLIRKKYGIKIVRLTPFQLRNKRIKKTLTQVISKRCAEIIFQRDRKENESEKFQVEPSSASINL